MRNLLALSLLIVAPAWAAKSLPPPASDLLLEINGSIYPKDLVPETCKDLLKGGKCPTEPYGHYHMESKKEGDLVYSKATFTGPEGLQVTEQSWEKDGHVQKAMVDNRALQKTSELEVKDGTVFYKVTDQTDQSVKTSDSKLDNNLVVASTVMSYIRAFHADLIAGKAVELRVAVMDRREAFTFRIKKVRDEKNMKGEEVMVLEMTPTSLIVKALVPSMYFYIQTRTGEMFAFEGRSALRRKDGDKYKEMSVYSSYLYPVNQFKVAEAARPSSETCTDDILKPGEVKCSIPK